MRGGTPAIRPIVKRRAPWRIVNNDLRLGAYADSWLMVSCRWATRSTENVLPAQGLCEGQASQRCPSSEVRWAGMYLAPCSGMAVAACKERYSMLMRLCVSHAISRAESA